MSPRRVVDIAPDRFDGWLERFEVNHAGPDPSQRIVEVERFPHDPIAVMLIRRGGYAVGLVRAGKLVAHKTGSRYVQSRTAAGGWSQQRYARRRANQADQLVMATRQHLLDAIGASVPAALITGGDTALVTQVLTDPRVAAWAHLPRRHFPGIPDPNATVLQATITRGRATRVIVEDLPQDQVQLDGSTD